MSFLLMDRISPSFVQVGEGGGEERKKKGASLKLA